MNIVPWLKTALDSLFELSKLDRPATFSTIVLATYVLRAAANAGIPEPRIAIVDEGGVVRVFWDIDKRGILSIECRCPLKITWSQNSAKAVEFSETELGRVFAAWKGIRV